MKCPMSIRVRCKDGETLEITNIVHEHNHEVSKAAFNHLFHQRRLDSGQKNEIESILKFKPSKRILQEHIHKTTGKVVILKDIHNMASSSKGADEANLQALLKEMKKVQDMTETMNEGVEDEFTKPLVLKNGCYSNPWKGFKMPSLGGLLNFLFYSKDNSNIPKKQELDKTLPVETPDFDRLNNPPVNDIQVTWIGHASVLVQFDGVSVLTDPIFSERCAPTQWFGPRRFRPVPCEIKKLPKVDIVVISHTHYDHLDHGSVKQLNERFGKDLSWYVPAGSKQWMTNVGCENVTELSWWEEATFSNKPNIKLAFTPAQHWCRRNLMDFNKSLWGSWVVKGPNHSFYFAGDTGYCECFKQIGKKYGPITLAAIPIGAYEPRDFMKSQHVNPEEAVKIHQEIKADFSLGIHWGTFKLTYEPYLEPRSKLVEELRASNLDISRFFTLPHGRVHTVGKDKLDHIE